MEKPYNKYYLKPKEHQEAKTLIYAVILMIISGLFFPDALVIGVLFGVMLFFWYFLTVLSRAGISGFLALFHRGSIKEYGNSASFEEGLSFEEALKKVSTNSNEEKENEKKTNETTGGPAKIIELEKLIKMKDKELISDEEFKQIKEEILEEDKKNTRS